MTSTPLPEQEVKIPEYPNVPRWLILNGEIDFRIFMLDPLAESGIRKGEAMTLPEQGGFNERLDEILRSYKRYSQNQEMHTFGGGGYSFQEAKAAIRTLVLEEIIGEDVDVPSQPRHAGKAYAYIGNVVRAEQRKKLGGTHGTK